MKLLFIHNTVPEYRVEFMKSLTSLIETEFFITDKFLQSKIYGMNIDKEILGLRVDYLNESKRRISIKSKIKESGCDIVILPPADNIKEYINLMNDSGLSSFMYLQNCYSTTSSKNMGVALALMLTKDFLKGDGACRVHGGGFAGTIQSLIPLDKVEEYTNYMNSVFGEKSAKKIKIRQLPVCEI